MSQEVSGSRRGGMKQGVSLPAVVLLLLGTLGISTVFGMLLLLPLYVGELEGDEANFAVILSSSAVPAVFCIGLLILYPERFRPYAVVAIAIAVYAVGAMASSTTAARKGVLHEG